MQRSPGVDQSRRDWLRGRFRTPAVEQRLPWLRDPEAFTETCTRCGECLRSCPEGIIAVGDGGFPGVDFRRGACTFCGNCAERCPEGLFLDTREPGRAWERRATISERCLAARGVLCRACEDSCDFGALSFRFLGAAIPGPVVDASSCSGCGACVAACPAGAAEVNQVVRNPEPVGDGG